MFVEVLPRVFSLSRLPWLACTFSVELQHTACVCVCVCLNWSPR